MKGKPTLQDVADRAKVSAATVSRILSGSGPASRETHARVKEAALELGMNLQARHKSRTIAFVLGNRNVLHPFQSHILVGAEDYCRLRGWDLLFLTLQYSPDVPCKEVHLPRVVRRRDIARAVILSGTNTENLLCSLKDKGIAFSTLGNNILGDYQKGAYDTVCSDDIGGGYELALHLQALGHRAIWFVGNLRLPWFARCYEGYARAMVEAGLTPCLSGFDSTDESVIGYLTTKSILDRGEPVTAIFAGTDPTAQGVYKALADRRIRIPEDISVAGCNDTLGQLLHPQLTTIREFPEQLGKQLVELVLNRLAQPDLPPQQITIPSEIVKRESCCPPKESHAGSDRTSQEALAASHGT
jgi:DNA-binding LacI/PurR family transcriptional regulator